MALPDAPGAKHTQLDAGLVARVSGAAQRVVAAARYAITGVSPANWFGPNQPVEPVAPPTADAGVEGRLFDYLAGTNLLLTPRGNDAINFPTLRALAKSWDILATIIQTCEDKMVRLKWTIRPIDEKQKPDARCDAMNKMFRRPDGEHSYQEWARAILHDMYVIDAATIYPLRNFGGDLMAFLYMDGAMIKRNIDVWGRTPMPPSPAYTQVIKNLPAVEYTFHELIYAPRNLRTDEMYGFSPVEQIVMTINLALRRQLTQLSYFTHGSTPDLIMSVPATWSPEQIQKYRLLWETQLQGNTQNRAGTKFVPEGMKPMDTKERALKDEFDEWCVRVACFSLGVNPQPFLKQMNRGEQKTQQEQAHEEGLEPIKTWFKTSVMDRIIQAPEFYGYDDLEFAYEEPDAMDPKVKSDIRIARLKVGAITINEEREANGAEGIGPLGDVPLIFTATGAVRLEDAANGVVPGLPDADPDGGGDGSEGNGGEGGQQGAQSGKAGPLVDGGGRPLQTVIAKARKKKAYRVSTATEH